MNLNYLLFHLIFTLTPVLVLGYLYIRDKSGKKTFKQGTFLMILLAIVYTSPWDRLLIDEGIWYYGENVVSLWILGIPLGEYLFFIIQTLGVSLFLYKIGYNSDKTENAGIFERPLFGLPFLLLSLFGLWMIILGPNSTLYMGAILAWAGPVISLQWIFGGEKLLEQKKTLIKSILIPASYLWIIDKIAITKGLWILPLETRTSLEIFGLPIEEMIFFLMTNIMVIQGVILYDWVLNSNEDLDRLKEKINIYGK